MVEKVQFVLGIFEKKILSNRKAETVEIITRIFELENSSKGKVQRKNKQSLTGLTNFLHRSRVFLTASANCGLRNTFVCSSDFSPKSLENAYTGGQNAKHIFALS